MIAQNYNTVGIGPSKILRWSTRKKDAHRGSYRRFVEGRQPILIWVKLKCLYQENLIKPVAGYKDF